MTTLTITERRASPSEPPIYGAWNPADPTDAMMIERLLKRRHVRAATVTVDFSPATSGALNVVCRSEVEAERDRLRDALIEARGWIARNAPLSMVLARIDAVLPAQSPAEPTAPEAAE